LLYYVGNNASTDGATVAQRVQVLLEDDLDGGEADETVHFALDGRSYEIDLKGKNADKLRAALEPFIDRARRQSGRVVARRTSRMAAPAGETAKVREWARTNGFEVNDRGRIPVSIREAYEKAN
jgi:hypothetical protein